MVMEYVLRFRFNITNNGTEYEVLIVGLKIAEEVGIDRIKVLSDSQLSDKCGENMESKS